MSAIIHSRRYHMEQLMIIEFREDDFKLKVEKWCEAGWTLVVGSQGMYSNEHDNRYWVWMQEPALESEDIDLDIGL